MSEQPGTYATYLWMLHRICHEQIFGGQSADFDKLIEYGWIRPAGDDGQNCSREWIDAFRAEPHHDGFDMSWFYVLTAKGHFMLAPRENGVEGLPVPFFTTKSRPLCTTPDGQQACVLLDELEAARS